MQTEETGTVQAYSLRDATARARAIRNNDEIAVVYRVQSSKPPHLQFNGASLDTVQQYGCKITVLDVLTPAPGTKPGL